MSGEPGHPNSFPGQVKPAAGGRVLNLRVALDEVEEGGDVVGEARAVDAAGREQGGGAGGVVGLLEEEVGDADARQPRHLLVEGEAERRADDGGGERDERLAPGEVARDE